MHQVQSVLFKEMWYEHTSLIVINMTDIITTLVTPENIYKISQKEEYFLTSSK